MAGELEKITGGLEKQAEGTLAERPSFIPEGDTTGTEGITGEDIRFSRLSIAQGLSTQLIEGDSSYINDLKMFDLFNDLTGTVYGKGPLYFIPVRRDVRRIEFDPNVRGIPLDMNVPPNDPRTAWTKDDDGKRIPPRATKFNEFVILLLLKGVPAEPMVLSIKDTNKFNRKAVERLNGFIKMHASKGKKSVPIYGVVYSIASKSEKNDNGTFGVPVIDQVGFVPTQELFNQAKDFAASLEGKTIVITREPGEDDDLPPQEGEVVGGPDPGM